MSATALHANILTSTTTVVSALTCNANTGATAGSVTVRLTAATASASSNVTVSLAALPAGINAAITAGTAVLTSSTASVTYTITALPGCAGASATGAWAPVVQFKAAQGAGSAANDVSYTASVTVSATGTSPLVLSSPTLTITCVNNNGSYTVGAQQTFTVSTAFATGGAGVNWDSSTVPTWLTVARDSAAGVLASTSSSVQFHAVAATGTCSGAIGSTKTASVHITNPPDPTTTYQTLTVTLMVVGPAPLTFSPTVSSSSPVVFNYTKNQTGVVQQSVLVKGANYYFAMDTTGLPSWLTVNYTSGQATSGGFTLQFTVTQVANSMIANTYNPAPIHLKVAGYDDTLLYVRLNLQNPAATLSIEEGTVRNLSWSVGQPLPTATITAVSSGAPIPYTVNITPGTNDPGAVVNPMSGLAYSFGTQLAVTFNPTVFAGAQPGSTLTTTIAVNSINVAFTISVQAPSSTAILTGISPASLPNAPAGTTFTVSLYGSGFVASTDPSQKTTVGIVQSGTTLTPNANIVSTVVSSSTITLQITVPSGTTDPLAFTTPNATVKIGVCNPNGSACTGATSSWPLIIDAGPTVTGVTNASTFIPLATDGTGTLAPYDIISLFGTNFCTSGGTGCTASQVMYPTVTNGVFANSVSPDNGGRFLQVFFYQHGSTTGGVAAPLLFATNTQINVIVPGSITTGQYDIVVKFGPTSTPLVSSAFTFTYAATDPGIFVVDSNNNGAILLANGDVANVSANAGRMRASAANSDIVSIYMTGLGIPTSTATNTTGGTQVAPTDCLSPANFATAAGVSTIDGLVLSSSLLYPGRLVPCFNQSLPYVTATVGGSSASATVKYVGFAPDEITGLYQVNIQLPASGATLTDMTGTSVATFNTAMQLPVQVTVAGPGTHSQANVGMWVTPAQTITLTTGGTYAFTVSALSGAATTPVALDQVNSDGTAPTFAVTAVTGSDTNGAAATTDFAVDASGNVTIGRAFLAGTYSVTITITDHATPALPTETKTLTFTVS